MASRGTKSDPRHKPGKSDRIEIEARLRSIEERLRDGIMSSEVLTELTGDHNQFCHKPLADGTPRPPCRRHLGISLKQARTYMSRVHKRMREASVDQAEILRDQIMAMLFRSYQGAFASGNYNHAASIAMKIARVGGVIDPAPNQQILALINGLPSDADRFPGDKNYQMQIAMRDMLVQAAALGQKGAAPAAAQVASGITDTYGIPKSRVSAEVEATIADKVRSHLVISAYLPDGPLKPLPQRVDKDGKLLPPVDDLATLEVESKKPEGFSG